MLLIQTNAIKTIVLEPIQKNVIIDYIIIFIKNNHFHYILPGCIGINLCNKYKIVILRRKTSAVCSKILAFFSKNVWFYSRIMLVRKKNQLVRFLLNQQIFHSWVVPVLCFPISFSWMLII